MNRKQLTLLVVVGLLLGGLAFYFARSQQREYEGADVSIGEKLLGELATKDIGQVTVKSADGEVNLVKNDVWVVRERANYPAAFTEIADLIFKCWNLKPVQSQQVGASQWSRLGLVPPGTADAGTNVATLIELKTKDGGAIKSLLLGKQQMRESEGQFGGGFPVGRWIALPDNKEKVFVVSETFSDVQAKPDGWLNKDFFKVEKLKSIALTSTNAEASWSLTRTNETAPWTLADAKPDENLDTTKLSSFNWAFSSPTFNDVHPRDAEVVKDAFAAPSVIQMDTFGGFAYTVKVGSQPDADSFWLTVETTAELPAARTPPAEETPEDKEKNDKAWQEEQTKLQEKLKKEKLLSNWVYKVSKWTVDSVLKDRSALMSTNAPAAAAAGSSATPPLPPLPGEIDIQTPLVPPAGLEVE